MADSETFTITAEDAANFDNCVAGIQDALPSSGAGINVCEVYGRIKPYLDRAIAIANELGPFGRRAADALTALRQVLETVCPQ